MRILILALVVLALCVGVAAPFSATAKESRAEAQARKSNPEAAYAKIRMKDDALETSATFTTDSFFQQNGTLSLFQIADHWLRVFINKKTGAGDIQLYQVIETVGDPDFYQLANYETADGPQQVELLRISTDVTHCIRATCTIQEHVAIPLNEAMLRYIASRYQPGGSDVWHYRLKAKSGASYDGYLLPAEAVAMLRRIDEYRAAHGLIQPH